MLIRSRPPQSATLSLRRDAAQFAVSFAVSLAHTSPPNPSKKVKGRTHSLPSSSLRKSARSLRGIHSHIFRSLLLSVSRSGVLALPRTAVPELLNGCTYPPAAALVSR